MLAIFYPFLLELLDLAFSRKEGEKRQKTFTPNIIGVKGIFYRAILTLGCLPYKAYIEIISILKTLYRLIFSHKHFLEWMTSEEAEKQSKTTLLNYYKMMFFNVIIGIIFIGYTFITKSIVEQWIYVIIGALWIIIPGIMCEISMIPQKKSKNISENEKEYLRDIARKTWQYFNDYLNEENNYLIPDNYQEDRKNIIVDRTSSTNIGLEMMAVIASYDMGFEELSNSIELLENIINVVYELPKWNGHLFNWYNIKTKEPLVPRYVSTVDSGNLIGYMYTTRVFLEEIQEQEKISYDRIENLKNKLTQMIEETNFKVLYSEEQRLFSIGFNIEENKLTDSYYDLLASEARQASLVAIAKKDVPSKHWNSLSRTLTTLGKYKGLVSWSGTAFEYLMPNINIPKYKGSLLDESCRFMIKSQMEYAKKLQIPWGISESAFNLKDLYSNYQYKAFGIPWLGLKRGLADDMVVAPYGGILAITDYPKEVYENLKTLEQYGMIGKFGFYESLDFTPERVEKGKKASVVKTYMAHHQSLILLSINNLINNNILQKRFMKNPEIKAISILLQERMPETAIITKENKEKVEKLKYKDYEDYVEDTYKKIDNKLIRGDLISSGNYSIAMNQKGEGISKYKDIYINRFKLTDDYPQGIFFNIKNIKSKKIITSNNNDSISFMPDKIKQEIISENIKTTIETLIAPEEPVEIRSITLENQGNSEEILEVTSYFEPVLSNKTQDYAHPAFNNLFLIYDFDEKTNSIIIKRKKREQKGQEIYLCANLSTNCETIGDLEYEIEKEKFFRKRKYRNTSNGKTIKTI